MPTSTLAAATTAPFDRDGRYSSFCNSQDGAIAKASLPQRQLPAKENSGSTISDGRNTFTGDNPEIDDEGFTKKSDSGIYFAMILSEYLDRQAMVEEVNVNQKQQEQPESPVTVAPLSAISETALPIQPLQAAVSRPPEVVPKPGILPLLDGQTTTAALSVAEAQAKEVIASLPNLIWVPAHKHPEIAPNEFVSWIQVHGANANIQNSKIRRQRSKLSRSMSYDDMFENEKDSSTTTTATGSSSGDESPASPKDHGDLLLAQKDVGNIFDQKLNDRLSIPPPPLPTTSPSRTLLRRSAVSARRTTSEPRQDKGHRSRRSPPLPRHAIDVSERKFEPVPPGGIHLYDKPVNMSEWIDLGGASLESTQNEQGILSRVHDAESQLLSIMDDDMATKTGEHRGAIMEAKKPNLVDTVEDPGSGLLPLPEILSKTMPTTLPPSAAVDTSTVSLPVRRSSSDAAARQKPDKRFSWFGSLLGNRGEGTNKKKRASTLLRRTSSISDRPPETTLGLSRVHSMNSPASSVPDASNNKKRGLAAFLSRSLSMKTSLPKKDARSTTQQQQPTRAVADGTVATSKHYINSYRLPIHVERAIYRLSHMKLANPRRPLHQQVVISNFMFWYLSIINPNSQQQQQQHKQQQQQQQQKQHQQQSSSALDSRGTNTSNNTQWSNEANEAIFRVLHHRTPKSPRKSVGRRMSQTSSGSSDEEDNVPLSFYRK